MCVVADTNTVLSAFLWGGPPRLILNAARDGRISLHTSPALLAEIEDVLGRDKFAARIHQVGSSVADMVSQYRALVTVELPAEITPTARDPDDDHVLACALSAEAQLIVTRDHDLLDLKMFCNIRIQPAHDALAIIPQTAA